MATVPLAGRRLLGEVAGDGLAEKPREKPRLLVHACQPGTWEVEFGR